MVERQTVAERRISRNLLDTCKPTDDSISTNNRDLRGCHFALCLRTEEPVHASPQLHHFHNVRAALPSRVHPNDRGPQYCRGNVGAG